MLLRPLLLLLVLAMPSAAQDADFVSEAHIPFEPGTLHLMAARFDSTAHRITRCDKSPLNAKAVCAIDGAPVYGTSLPYGMPETELKSAVVEIDGQRIALDTSGMFNPWFRKPGESFALTRHPRGEWAVRAVFSDGGGTYAAEWVIVDGRATRTMLTGREDVVFAFLRRMEAQP